MNNSLENFSCKYSAVPSFEPLSTTMVLKFEYSAERIDFMACSTSIIKGIALYVTIMTETSGHDDNLFTPYK